LAVSLKAFLATEQRFAGLRNGVLQDILFKARMNPRTKINTLTSEKICELHSVIVKEIQAMIQQGGRGTESDLFRQYGRYLTLSQRYANKEVCQTVSRPSLKKLIWVEASTTVRLANRLSNPKTQFLFVGTKPRHSLLKLYLLSTN